MEKKGQEIQIKLVLDGMKEFKENVAEIKKEIEQLNSALRETVELLNRISPPRD